MSIIAVADSLQNIKSELEREGYEVVSLENQAWQNAKAVIVSGIDEDIMNIEDSLTNAPIIDATGMTAEEIINDLQYLK
ncbi:hypothetical protein GGQ84_002661 [Desulfitispora alkaliphila]|uniref:YkuS family protein n=1 Tax=Desulfitispora alkaliphila TaxID=622674 RepID=UPI003D1E408A